MTTLSTIGCHRETRLDQNRSIFFQPSLIAILIALLLVIGIVDKSNAASWPTVSRGDLDLNSVDVTMIQYLLRAKSLSTAIDGRYGVQTRRRVAQFQAMSGLNSTGKVDGTTWRRLIVVLRPNEQGFAVRAMQAALQQYDDKLLINGHFDRRTIQSLHAFEKLKHLSMSNVVSANIWLRFTDAVPD